MIAGARDNTSLFLFTFLFVCLETHRDPVDDRGPCRWLVTLVRVETGEWGVRLSFRAENRSDEREKPGLRENSRIGHTSDHRYIRNSSHSHSKYPSITLDTTLQHTGKKTTTVWLHYTFKIHQTMKRKEEGDQDDKFSSYYPPINRA